MRCSDEVLAEIAALRAEGVSVAIDDFGAGYSNLARMKSLPVDRLKLDTSLTSDIDRCEVARTIVTSIVHLAHGLGAEIVAEGVERPEQMEILSAIGCDLLQGYLFAEPMPEDDYIRWISERTENQNLALRA